MKTLCKTSLLGLAFVSTASMAQLSNFTGWEAGASISSTKARIEYKTSSSFSESDANNTSLSLHGGYGIALNDDYAILLGFDLNTDKTKYGKLSGTNRYAPKNAYAISIAPAMLLNDNALLFVKFSSEVAASDCDGCTLITDRNGFGFGFGGRYLLRKGTYVQAEIKGVKYNDIMDESNSSSIKIYNSQVNIGIGFNF